MRKPESTRASQKDCDNQKVVATILSKLKDRGFKTSLDNLDVFIPGIKQNITREMDEYIKEQYHKGVNADLLLKTYVPEKELELLNNKAISALLEFKARCQEFKEEQQGSGKKKSKKSIKSKKTVKKSKKKSKA